MPHADIKYTSDIQIDLKTLMSDIEKIILDLDPTSGACKGRALKVDEYHHSHINIEIRLFATKQRDIDLLNELINKVNSRAKSLLKKAYRTGRNGLSSFFIFLFLFFVLLHP